MAKFINGVTNYNEWRDHAKDNKRYLERMALISLGCKSILDELRLVQAVNVSAMSGKLEGFWSVSTSVLMNPICQQRAKDPDSICHDCYAAVTASGRSGLTQALETNYRILNDFLISEDAWRTLNWPTSNGHARVESFGDAATVTCTRNYLRIENSHSHIKFGVWTKNVPLWIPAFELEGGKPKNMKFIVSSPIINMPMEIPDEWLPYIDHRFTVYTEEYAREHGIEINCGGRKCMTCMNCYEDGPFDIAELMK